MHARDQSSILSTGENSALTMGFYWSYTLLLSVARSYALLVLPRGWYVCVCMCPTFNVVCICVCVFNMVVVYVCVHTHIHTNHPPGTTS